MRALKFRGWDTVDKEMKLPTTLKLSRETVKEDDLGGKVFQVNCNGADHIDYYNERILLEQYTGLKDKNGKEIYEGDIMADRSQGVKRNKHGHEKMVWVYWNDKHAQWELHDNVNSGEMNIHYARWEIIGNIHENSELLAGSEKLSNNRK